MTVIRPNSITGITSITAQANEINVFRHNGVLAGLQLNGVNHHTSAGVSTFHTVNILGNLDVAGVLTYQDVTNVDSLGIGTFRTGINVSGGQLDVGSNIKLGNAGVITATAFVGDGSGLTGAGPSLTGSTNNTIVTVTGANAIQGESNLKFDGDYLTLTTNADQEGILLQGGDNYNTITLDANRNVANYSLGDVRGKWNGVEVNRIRFNTGTDTTNKDEGWLTFWTKPSGAGIVERLRIGSDGKLLLGDGSYNSNSNGFKMSIKESSNENAAIIFQDTDNMKGGICGIAKGTNQIITGTTNIDFVLGSVYADTHIITGTPSNQVGMIGMTIKADTGKIGIGRIDPVNFVDIARGQDEENILLVRGADNTSEYGALGIYSGNYVITGGGAGSTNTGIMFRTATSGNETNRLLITSAGHVEPATDNTYNFGSLTKRWANLYTADLNLSNEGSKNDVDGTWGQYTIQEGEDNLYLINKRSGKKYKFLLQEVS